MKKCKIYQSIDDGCKTSYNSKEDVQMYFDAFCKATQASIDALGEYDVEGKFNITEEGYVKNNFKYEYRICFTVITNKILELKNK